MSYQQQQQGPVVLPAAVVAYHSITALMSAGLALLVRFRHASTVAAAAAAAPQGRRSQTLYCHADAQQLPNSMHAHTMQLVLLPFLDFHAVITAIRERAPSHTLSTAENAHHNYTINPDIMQQWLNAFPAGRALSRERTAAMGGAV